jgi:DNA-binding NarL/FixJ family response regulator
MKTTGQKPTGRTLGKVAVVSPRRIFIVDDHPIFRVGLKQMINQEPDLIVCGEADDYDHALEGIVRLKPDLALVDITLPGKSGLELIKKLRSENHPLKLLVVSMHDEALCADRVLRAGGDGYFTKEEDPGEVIQAMRDVLAGHIYVSEAVLSGAAPAATKLATTSRSLALDPLNDSEIEILELLGRGRSNQEIAHQLSLNVRTVATRAAQIKRKLKLKSANALVRFAVLWVESAKV